MTTDKKYIDALSGWVQLNERLRTMTLDELHTLLDLELSSENRATYVKRIHQRIVRLQSRKDRAELLN